LKGGKCGSPHVGEENQTRNSEKRKEKERVVIDAKHALAGGIGRDDVGKDASRRGKLVHGARIQAAPGGGKRQFNPGTPEKQL